MIALILCFYKTDISTVLHINLASCLCLYDEYMANCRLLLDNGADVLYKDRHGYRVLQVATAECKEYLLKTLSPSTLDTLHNMASTTSDSSTDATVDIALNAIHNAQTEHNRSSNDSCVTSSTEQHMDTVKSTQSQHIDNSSNGSSSQSDRSSEHSTAITASALSCPMCSEGSCYVMVRTKCCKQLVCKACARAALIASSSSNASSSLNSSNGTCSLCT
jgi:hypothetical protein